MLAIYYRFNLQYNIILLYNKFWDLDHWLLNTIVRCALIPLILVFMVKKTVVDLDFEVTGRSQTGEGTLGMFG